MGPKRHQNNPKWCQNDANMIPKWPQSELAATPHHPHPIPSPAPLLPPPLPTRGVLLSQQHAVYRACCAPMCTVGSSGKMISSLLVHRLRTGQCGMKLPKIQTRRFETIAGSWCTLALLPIFDPLKVPLGPLVRALEGRHWPLEAIFGTSEPL